MGTGGLVAEAGGVEPHSFRSGQLSRRPSTRVEIGLLETPAGLEPATTGVAIQRLDRFGFGVWRRDKESNPHGVSRGPVFETGCPPLGASLLDGGGGGDRTHSCPGFRPGASADCATPPSSWCRRRESNPHGFPRRSERRAYTSSATPAFGRFSEASRHRARPGGESRRSASPPAAVDGRGGIRTRMPKHTPLRRACMPVPPHGRIRAVGVEPTR